MTCVPAKIDARLLGKCHNRPNFDRSIPRPWNFSRDTDRIVLILRIHQIIPAKLFLGLGERPVRYLRFAVADPHGFRSRRRLKGVSGPDYFGELVAKIPE